MMEPTPVKQMYEEAKRFENGVKRGVTALPPLAMREAMTIPPDVPHDRVQRLFTHDRWLDRCEALYRTVIAGNVRLAA